MLSCECYINCCDIYHVNNLLGSLYHLLHVYVVVDVCEVCNDTFVLYQQWQAIMQCSAANAATAEILS